jgi:multiple sugar transport system permease protein
MFRWHLYLPAIALTAFVLLPIYLITIAAFSPRDAVFSFPKQLIPSVLSAETMLFFLNTRGVAQSAVNSVIVGAITLALSLAIGAPAGYALARFGFRGREAFKVLILTTRAFPIVILSVPLAVTFIDWRLYDTLLAVAIVHTALALPTTVLITSSIFVAVPRDLEEAALTLGCTPVGAFGRVVLPLAWLRSHRAVIGLHLLHPPLPVQHVGQDHQVMLLVDRTRRDARQSGGTLQDGVDPFGNILGIMDNPHYLEVLGSTGRA